MVQAAAAVSPEGVLPVSLQRTQAVSTPDQVLWTLIRNRTNAISFRRYREFIDGVMCRGVDVRNPVAHPEQRAQLHRHPGLRGAQAGHRHVPDAGVRDRRRRRRLRHARSGFLDPDLMETELADPAFAERVPRRRSRAGTAGRVRR